MRPGPWAWHIRFLESNHKQIAFLQQDWRLACHTLGYRVYLRLHSALFPVRMNKKLIRTAQVAWKANSPIIVDTVYSGQYTMMKKDSCL